jgi:4-amino-4-deoxy-L-arabinose transferase-like glycosyltransferase
LSPPRGCPDRAPPARTLWRWRRQLPGLRQQRHLGLPLALASVPLINVIATRAGDRALLLALPALAALAAFALPTFKRSAAALIDWFTVLFFTGWAIFIWVMWIAALTGFPRQPAANIARLAPGFEQAFQWPAVAAALAATLGWIALARWRTGRHRAALWKSLVLPAAGAALCWLLLMTLWLPALDYARSYKQQMRDLRQLIGDATCVEVFGLATPQLTAVRWHGGWTPQPAQGATRCQWLLVNIDARPNLPSAVPMTQWRAAGQVGRRTDKNDTLLVFQRAAAEIILPNTGNAFPQKTDQ